MGRDLTNLHISESFQYLLQISGSENDLNDGLGNDVDLLTVTASYATTASFAENVSTPTLQEVTDEGATTTNTISVPRIDVGGSGTNGVVNVNSSTGAAIFRATNSGVEIGSIGTNYTLLHNGDTTHNGDVNQNGNIDATGFSVTASFLGDLDGNATTATSASHAILADSASVVLTPQTGENSDFRMAFVKDVGNDGYGPVFFDEDGEFTYNPSLQSLNLGGGAAGSGSISTDLISADIISARIFSGSLTGTASYASQADLANEVVVETDTTDAVRYVSFTDVQTGQDVQRVNSRIKANPASGSLTADIFIGGEFSGSSATFTSASIGYLQTITGSAKIIGDAFIILNNDTPTERYAGLIVIDSGSVNTTASFQFDGQTNDWFYQYTDDGGATDEFGVVMFGPGYNTKGAHVYPSNNTILKGTGDHHIVDSIISDNGSTVFVAGTLEAENILAQVAFTGDLIGTASYADFATTASHVPGIISAGLVSGLGTDAMRSSDDLTTTAPVASGDYSIALGDSSNASATDTISIGRSAVSALADGVAIGHEAVTSNNNSLALGRGASATGSYSLAINANNAPVLNVLTTNQDAIFSAAVSASAFSGSFFGNGSGLTDVGGLVSGTGTDSIQSAAFLTAAGAADASGDEAVAIGRDAQATAIDSVGIGTQAGATGNKSIAIGEASQASTVAVAIGRLADASTYGATAVGQQASATGQRSAAYGFQAETDNDYGLALGNAADATGNIAFALNFNQAAAMTGTTSNQDVYFQGGIEASGSVRGIVDDLSIVSNVATMDCSTGNFFTLTLQNATSTQLTATNIQEGQTINLKITQNATSAGDLTFDTMFEFEGGTAFVPSAAISEVDVMTFISFDGTSLQATGLKNFS